ncbi:MAG: hypothetical protein AAGI38_23515 [Bacteroidota bacterium]
MQNPLDLWPAFNLDAIRTPASILSEQASLIASKTHNLLKAEVRTRPVPASDNNGSGQFHVELLLIAPKLGDFTYRVCWTEHGLQPYPIKLVANQQEVIAQNEAEFLDWLGKTLGAAEVRQAVQLMYAQSELTPSTRWKQG